MQLLGLGQLKAKGIEKKQFGHDFVYRYPESKDMPELDALQLGSDIAKEKHSSIAFYFHIPFCSKQCRFCHYFKETKFSAKSIETYIAALQKELAAYRKLLDGKAKVQSVFFGGGTPTLLKPKQLNGILEFFAGLFPMEEKTEVSVESSPETLGEKKLLALREGGFNRLSIGAQDFNEAVLRKSNRAHSPKQAEKAVQCARKAGFENINMDLLYGLPGQSPENWRQTTKKAVLLGLDSITASDLRVQKNAEFYGWPKELFPSMDEMREMYYCFVESFLQAGYLQQFPYQFVKKGREMMFLENQWASGEFLGLGASSCSFSANWDYNNALPLHKYFQKVEEQGLGAATGKRLLPQEQMKRFVALGLKRSGLNRRDSGVSKSCFRERFGQELNGVFGSVIGEMKETGLLEENRDFVSLSYNGLFFHDEIARKFF